MFMNEYSHTIDAKGRMILPAKFREELGSRFVLAPSLDTCLNIYPKERWDALLLFHPEFPHYRQIRYENGSRRLHLAKA